MRQDKTAAGRNCYLKLNIFVVAGLLRIRLGKKELWTLSNREHLNEGGENCNS